MRDLFYIYRGNLSADYDSNKSLPIPHNTEHKKLNDIYPGEHQVFCFNREEFIILGGDTFGKLKEEHRHHWKKRLLAVLG